MGKRHGGLVNAGKVKGMVPKIDNGQEHNKKPRGRALKKLKFNKRFVNNVNKSPNSQGGVDKL
ncbi:MAG: hypothetical protein Hyperionvirus2_15 [Hyperionvirus sp.]|uniref:40S ribosomal protein S30 n=1 Tax=Hyperionvirus sp. TaxID=2487770 RepID=A0A3G5A5Z0_9VIRU|nr:MAG: hypothetical protein Hyperionvirus2_15 [Hyperionvirus sp.]